MNQNNPNYPANKHPETVYNIYLSNCANQDISAEFVISLIKKLGLNLISQGTMRKADGIEKRFYESKEDFSIQTDQRPGEINYKSSSRNGKGLQDLIIMLLQHHHPQDAIIYCYGRPQSFWPLPASYPDILKEYHIQVGKLQDLNGVIITKRKSE